MAATTGGPYRAVIVRDALLLFVDDAGTAHIVEDLRLPADAMAAVHQSTQLREQAAAPAAVRSLQDGGLTLRDAGEVLGLSFQRVRQLAS